MSAGTVVVALMYVFAVSLCQTLKRADEYDPDTLDLYCPNCDSTDLYDWPPYRWWKCGSCGTMFEMDA